MKVPLYSRRRFLKCAIGGGCGLGLSPVLIRALFDGADAHAIELASDLSRVEAMYYRKLDDNEVECLLCPRRCVVGHGERGYCDVRENRDGTYYTLVHSRPCSIHADPIEKKPLYHFLPGTTALSFATVGCNLDCKFCQNWEISQAKPEHSRNYYLPPEQVVALAKEHNCRTMAYTYSEPIVFYEYVYDTALRGREEGIRSVMISGGFINPDPLRDLCQHLDAVKIDLKGFSEDYYREICRGRLQPVLDCLKVLSQVGIWFEIVNLVIPTLNDKPEKLREMCRWIASELGPDVPVHFSRFHPMYLLKNLPKTPVSTLERAWEIAREEGLTYAYIGNVAGHAAESTYCPKCGKIVIKRMGYTILDNAIVDGKCRFCGEKIAGVWA